MAGFLSKASATQSYEEEPELWDLGVPGALFMLHLLQTCLAEISLAFQLSALSEREPTVCFKYKL